MTQPTNQTPHQDPRTDTVPVPRPALPAALPPVVSLYVPATHAHLAELLQGDRPAPARRLIVCTEDAVREDRLEEALDRLERALDGPLTPGLTVQVRPRTPAVLRRIARMPGAAALHGYVLPKITLDTLAAWLDASPADRWLSPTIEDASAFRDGPMERLAERLLACPWHLTEVRVGGNDLLGLLGLRREFGVTAYETPLGAVIDRLVSLYRPHGLAVSAPVYDVLDDHWTLGREVVQDLQRGTQGKTAVHPDQVRLIERLWRPTAEDTEEAALILHPAAPAVFRHRGRMCEPATHRPWAEAVQARAALFGMKTGAVEDLGA